MSNHITSPLESKLAAHEELDGLNEIQNLVGVLREWIKCNLICALPEKAWFCLDGLADEPDPDMGNGFMDTIVVDTDAAAGGIGQKNTQNLDSNIVIPKEAYFLCARTGRIQYLNELLSEKAIDLIRCEKSPLNDLGAFLPKNAHGNIWFCVEGQGLIAARLDTKNPLFYCLEKPNPVMIDLPERLIMDIREFPHNANFYPTMPGIAQIEMINQFGQNPVEAASKLSPGEYRVIVDNGLSYFIKNPETDIRFVGVC